MAKALSKLRREGKENLPESEGGFTEEGLQSKLAHMRQVKERCYSSYRRCLRFWQFEGREGREDKALNSSRQLKEDLPLYRISARRY